MVGQDIFSHRLDVHLLSVYIVPNPSRQLVVFQAVALVNNARLLQLLNQSRLALV